MKRSNPFENLQEVARIGHLITYPGAASSVTATRSSMDRELLDVTYLGSDAAKLQSNPFHQQVMEYFNDSNPNSDFNKKSFNPAVDRNGNSTPDVQESRGLDF